MAGEGIFYVLRGGCTRRMMPHDLPPWVSGYQAFMRRCVCAENTDLAILNATGGSAILPLYPG